MDTVALKSELHEIIDRIDNNELLQSLRDFLKVKESKSPGSLWNSLSEDQKKEVLLSFDESDDEKNLISRDRFFQSDK